MNTLWPSFRTLCMGLLMISTAFLAHAQEVGMLSPLVGPLIDGLEYQRYQLDEPLGWPTYELDSLRILPRGEDMFVAFAYLIDGSSEAKELNRADLSALRQHIENRGEALLSTWESLQETLASGENPSVFLLTHSGQIIRGEAMSIDAYQLALMLRGDQLSVTLEEIDQLEIDEISEEEEEPTSPEGRFGFVNPLHMRYFFSPTALPTQKKKSYLQVIGLSTFNYHRGLSEHLSISAGTDASTLVLSALTPGVLALGGTFNVKWQGQITPRLHVGGGLLGVGLAARIAPNNTTPLGFGLLTGWMYGVATYGTADYNMSVSVGWVGLKGFGDIQSPLVLLTPPVISFGGTARISRRLAFCTESWLISDLRGTGINRLSVMAILVGGRLIYDSYTINAGLSQLISRERNPAGATTTGFLFPIPIPYADFTYYF